MFLLLVPTVQQASVGKSHHAPKNVFFLTGKLFATKNGDVIIFKWLDEFCSAA